MQISERVQRIEASQSLAMAARAKEMKAAGIDVISMSLGEPDMDTPEHIRRAAQEAIDNGWTHYGPVAGISSLKEAIANVQNNRPNQKYKNIDKPSCTAINIDKEEIKNAHSTSAMPDGLRGLERNHPQALTNELAAPVDANTPNLLPEEQHVEYLQKCDLPSYKNDKNEIEWTASDVIVSVGAKMAIYNAIQTIVNPGDEVIIPMPSWVSYSEMVKVAGGKVVPIMTRYEDRYCLTAEQLRNALTEKTRMLILCSPNNPTGSVYSYEELAAIVDVLRDWPNVVVLSDEIYSALVYTENINIDKPASPDKQKNAESTAANGDLRVTDNQIASEQAPRQIACEFRTAGTDARPPQDSFQKCDVPSYENTKNKISNLKCKISNTSTSMAQFPELANRLVLVNGVSKAYAMTGWRIGWLMSKNKDFIEACTRLQGQQVTCATMVAQRAAEAALTGSQECVEQMRQVFAERRELICRLAADIPGFRFDQPQGAFYLFPEVSSLYGKRPNPSQSRFECSQDILRLKGREKVLSSADDIVDYLLEVAHVAVVSGSAFGCPDCIRLSYAISTAEITEAMRRIKAAVERLVNQPR